MTLVTRDPATGLRHSGIRQPNSQPPTPSGCRWCGVDQREHAQRWKLPAGWHQWPQPTQDQIKRRMQERRSTRSAP
jgi:hypothetical protein